MSTSYVQGLHRYLQAIFKKSTDKGNNRLPIQITSWGLFHKTFFNVIYGKMAINYGIFEIMIKFRVKIWHLQ